MPFFVRSFGASRAVAAGVATLALAGCAVGDPSAADPAASSSSAAPSARTTPDQTPPGGTATPRTTLKPRTSPTQEKRTMSKTEATRALFAAAESGDVAAARKAIDAKADLRARNDRRRTPLVVATKARRTGVAVLMLEAGADPNAKDDIKDSAFLYAGAEGLNEILRATLRHGADVESTNRFGGTALIPASEHGHTETVRILINAGVPLDHVNDLGWTALLEAIVLSDGSSDQVDVVRQLIGAGADPTIRDGDGRTPRSLAAARGFTEIVALIDDAEEVRERGQRLISAARDGDTDRVERLLEQGASIAARDTSGATALVAAAYGNHLEIARLLLEAGADPNAKDETVQSAYLIATSEVGDDPRLLRLTLRYGADVRSLDSWKGTGLIRAADRGFDSVIRVLLDPDDPKGRLPYRISIDHVNRIGYTALHEAVILGDGGPSHQRTVAVLVDAGVDETVRDPRGDTALDVARARGYSRIVELLS
ncbi:MAG TPA: ankyrin repeat domain-containing protein [Microlunatus sp.]|nr:ankyrin repeat domain-containing protein [Microlunatus sp.]